MQGLLTSCGREPTRRQGERGDCIEILILKRATTHALSFPISFPQSFLILQFSVHLYGVSSARRFPGTEQMYGVVAA